MMNIILFTALKEQIIQALGQHGLPPEVLVLVISTLPISELRGAIPVGINYLGLPWLKVFPIAIIGNMIPVPFLLLIFKQLVNLGEKIPFIKNLLIRTERRGAVIDRYKLLGLIIFVGIPLPVTGAWTGALGAKVFDIPFHKSMIGIFLGVLIAGVIVTTLSLLGLYGAIIAGIALFGLVIRSMVTKK